MLGQLFRPLSLIYLAGLRLKDRAREKGFTPTRSLSVPVISIGNLTVGGTGKTPCTIALAGEALARGYRPAVLTRGYRGRAPGTTVVSDGETVRLTADQAGDEAVLMAERLPGVPVIKCPDRYDGGQRAVDRLGADLLILDDGFQHRRLARTVDIVLVSGAGRPADGMLLPAGRLREPFSALRRADEIVLSDAKTTLTAQVLRRIEKTGTEAPVSRMPYRVSGFLNRAGEKGDPERLAREGFLAFCGLGNPLHFRDTLVSQEYDVTHFLSFGDHHTYTERDLRRLRHRAAAAGVRHLVTTEKDLVKIHDRDVWALRVDAVLEKGLLERVFSKLPEEGRRGKNGAGETGK